jgi:hypothetical protein
MPDDPEEPTRDPPTTDGGDSQPISKPPGSGGSTNAPAIFGAGFLLGMAAGFLLANTVCNRGGPDMTAGRGTSTGVVVQASPDSGTAAPPREKAPQEQPPNEVRPQ